MRERNLDFGNYSDIAENTTNVILRKMFVLLRFSKIDLIFQVGKPLSIYLLIEIGTSL
jgi:hypothetical protein